MQRPHSLNPVRRFALLAGLALPIGAALAQESQPAAPDPARFADAIRNFGEWDRKNSFPRDAILFVGSSSIVGWRTHEAFPEWPVINRGFGGSHVTEVTHYVDQVVKPYRARVIVLYCGDNDIQDGIPPKRVAENYAEFIRRVRAFQPETPIVLISTKPSTSRWAKWPLMQESNGLLKDLAARESRVTYVDLATPLLGENGEPKAEYYVADKLHLSPAGYDVWNRALKPVLEKLMRE